MRDLAEVALNAAEMAGASYADIRISRHRSENLQTREQRVIAVSHDESFGFGVRVLVDGAWGFAASHRVSEEEIREITRRAVRVARANQRAIARAVQLAPEPAHVDVWQTPTTRDPFKDPIERKLDLLLKVNEEGLRAGATFVRSSLSCRSEDKTFASTDGTFVQQLLVRVWPQFTVTAVDRSRGEFRSRNSYAQPMGRGYDYVEEYPLVEDVRQAAEDARQMLTAKSVEPGPRDIIIHPTQLFLTIHESVGHSTELDRILGYEANYAGTSFCTLEKLGTLKFASEIVNFVGNRTEPGALATCAYDDEGVGTKRWDIVRDGVLVNYQTTREQAHLLGQQSSLGCSYADSWSSIQFQRMPNVSLMPGTQPLGLDDLIAATEDGLLFRGRASYSIDQQRYNFQFGAQTVWEIKKGKVVGLVDDAVYQSNTLQFWNACDLLGGPESYELGGTFNDGKGEPPQRSSVSHGCVPARFRQINILNTRRSR